MTKAVALPALLLMGTGCTVSYVAVTLDPWGDFGVARRMRGACVPDVIGFVGYNLWFFAGCHAAFWQAALLLVPLSAWPFAVRAQLLGHASGDAAFLLLLAATLGAAALAATAPNAVGGVGAGLVVSQLAYKAVRHVAP